MKKRTSLLTGLLLLILPLVLMACSQTSQKTYTHGSDEVVIAYKGDTVETITLKSTRTYEQLGVTSKKDAQRVIDNLEELFKEYELEFQLETEVTDKDASYTLTIDADKMNSTEFKKMYLLPGVDDFTSLKEVEENFKKAGYEEKK